MFFLGSSCLLKKKVLSFAVYSLNMGERKGQNFYYPPDFDYKKHKSLNAYHGTHALRERAAKIKQGILIIRFFFVQF